MTTPTFSIIIPFYNCAEFLPDCLDSILGQSYSNFELLLINDGSTDDSGVICKQYAGNDDRIHYFEVARKGVSAARNFGIDHASGDYLLFFDADDVVLPDALCNYSNAIELTDADIIKCGFETVYIDGSLVQTIVQQPKLITNGNSLQMLKESEASGYCGFVWNSAFKRTVIGQTRFDTDLLLYEDHVFSRQCFMNCNSMYLTDHVVYRYNKRPGNSLGMSRSPIRQAKGAIEEHRSKIAITQGKDKELEEGFDEQLYGRLCVAFSFLRSCPQKIKTIRELFNIVFPYVGKRKKGHLRFVLTFARLVFHNASRLAHHRAQ